MDRVILQSMDPENNEHDVYDELLTQAEIQGNINKVNSKSLPHLGQYKQSQLSKSLTKVFTKLM